MLPWTSTLDYRIDRKGFATMYSPIFSLSCRRSGSTLLRYILDTHPSVCCPGELDLGKVAEGLFNVIRSTVAHVDDQDNLETARRREALTEVRFILAQIMTRYTEAKGKCLWCDKSPANVPTLHFLSEVFPEAQYILLYRNCLDVAYSCINSNPLGVYEEFARYIHRYPENYVAAMMEYWADWTEKMLEWEEQNKERSVSIHYESMVFRPNETLKAVFEFIGVTWDNNLLELVFTTDHDPGHGDLKALFSTTINSDTVGKGRRLPVPHVNNPVLPRVNLLHDKLGYPRIDPDGAGSPFEAADREMTERCDQFLRRVLGTHRDETKALRGTCRLLVQGVGTWFLDLSGREPRISVARGTGDCTISMAADVWIDLMEGRRAAIEIYEAGEVGIRGDAVLAASFGKLLFQRHH